MSSPQTKGRKGNRKINNRVNKTLNYTETTDTNQQRENLTTCNNNSYKREIREFKVTT